MLTVLITIVLLSLWFVLGFFAARLSLLDDLMYDEPFWAWGFFFLGPVGWMIGMFAHEGGHRLEAHFLTSLKNLAVFKFFNNKFDSYPSLTNTIFRVKD